MPNVTVYISSEAMPAAEVLESLAERCTFFCTSTLRAAFENVHVIFVEVRHGRGHPVFVEVLLRDETFRPASVMDRFVQQVDGVFRQQTGLVARIRCFAFPAPDVHALN
ncbi:MAG: hypothetical protein WB797_01530 [Nocardioides sp.]